MLCGSSPTVILARRVFVSGRITLTLSSFGLTAQISRSFTEMAIGLEFVAADVWPASASRSASPQIEFRCSDPRQICTRL